MATLPPSNVNTSRRCWVNFPSNKPAQCHVITSRQTRPWAMKQRPAALARRHEHLQVSQQVVLPSTLAKNTDAVSHSHRHLVREASLEDMCWCSTCYSINFKSDRDILHLSLVIPKELQYSASATCPSLWGRPLGTEPRAPAGQTTARPATSRRRKSPLFFLAADELGDKSRCADTCQVRLPRTASHCSQHRGFTVVFSSALLLIAL